MSTNILYFVENQFTLTATIATNSDFRDSFVVVQNDAVTPVDLTGIDFHASFVSPNGATVLATKTEDGTIINGGKTGTVEFSVPYTTIGKISPGTYNFDVIAIADGYQLSAAINSTLTITAGISL